MIRSEFDVLTGDYKEIELTFDEIANREENEKRIEAIKKAEIQAEVDKAAAKQSAQAKLAALGLTPNEITAIIGV